MISSPVAAELCDTGVNMGPLIPIKWFHKLAECLFNNQQRFYPDLIVDNRIRFAYPIGVEIFPLPIREVKVK